MKESKLGARVSGIVLLLSVIVVLVLPEGSMLKNIFLVVLDGGFASTIISTVTYLTEERRSCYNFYVAAEKYAEKLKSFSQFLAESYIYIENASDETEKQRLMQVVIDKMEKISDDLYEAFQTIQKETREFEAYSVGGNSRDRIRWYMRTFYDDIKISLECIMTCKELNERNALREEGNYEDLKSIYDKLSSVFLDIEHRKEKKVNEEKNNEKESTSIFTLTKCVGINYVLDQFILHGCISLRNGGRVNRSAKYEINNKGIKNNEKKDFSNGMALGEYSVRIDNPHRLEEDEFFPNLDIY